MGKKGIVVATTVLAVMTVIFGVISAVFSGQDDHDDRSVCRYRRSPATACGILAAVLALMTQILASVAIGCCGAWQNPKRANRIAAGVFYVISWILAVIVVLAFLGGALLGIEGSMYKTIGNTSCVGGVGGRVFVNTTFLFLVVVALEVSSYLLVQKIDHHQAATGNNPPLVPTATPPSAPAATSKDDTYDSAHAPADKV